MGEPVVHHRSPDFRPIYERCLARLREVSRTEQRRAALHGLRHGRVRVGGRESRLAGRPAPRRLGGQLRRALGDYRPARTAPRSTTFATPGARRPTRTTSARGSASARRRRCGSSTPRPRRASSADMQALAAAAKESGALVVVDAVSSLGAVPCETDAWGLDVVVSGSQKALMTPPGLGTCAVSEAALRRDRHLAALLLRLGADAQGAGEARRCLHAAGVARCRPRRRARPPARGRPRRGLRTAHPARPCRARRREGDGPRALLARRGSQRRRHRGARARRASTRPSSSRGCATASG